MADIKLLGNDDTDYTTAGGFLLYQRYQVLATGTIHSLRMKMNSASNLQIAIYSDNNGEPNALLQAVYAFAGESGWNTIPITDLAVIQGEYYWMAARTQNTRQYLRAEAGWFAKYKSFSYGTTFPDIASYTGDYNDYKLAYAAWGEEGGPVTSWGGTWGG